MLLPSAYFPPVSWVSHHLAGHAVAGSGRFVRQTIRCRCLIQGPNGVQQLGVPLRKHQNLSQIGDILIDNSQPWRIRHWRALTSAYSNSPYFEYFEDDVRTVILPAVPQERLLDLNAHALSAVIHLMNARPNAPEPIDRPLINPWDSDDRPCAADLSVRPYRQVWADRFPFEPDLSILDLLFCTGRQYAEHLLSLGR